MNLVIELKVNAAKLWMLFINLPTEQNVVVVGCACRIGSAAHPIRKA
jgi:hypothetical protein